MEEKVIPILRLQVALTRKDDFHSEGFRSLSYARFRLEIAVISRTRNACFGALLVHSSVQTG
jgi:hypothetical protein